MSDIKFIRLNTGEDLITGITSIQVQGEEPYYILNSPMKVMYTTPSKSGYYSVGLGQWVSSKICDDQDFIVYPNEILTIGTPTEKMIEYYWSCVDHFIDVMQEEKKEASDAEKYSSHDGPMEDSETMELVKEALESLKIDKSKLH